MIAKAIKGIFNHKIFESIKEKNRTKIIIYPNPSSDYISINTEEEIWKLQIIKMNGEKIDLSPSGNGIDISFLNKGIYILNFNNRIIKFVKN